MMFIIAILSLLVLNVGCVKVYIGGGDNSMGAFNGYLSAPSQWTYTRANADGYYINCFALDTNASDPVQTSNLKTMASLFTNKNLFYETDLVRCTDSDDAAKIGILRNYFNVDQTTCNRGWSASRIAALQSGGWRPVLSMGAPWEISGNIWSAQGESLRDAINHTSGSATDGPMGLWIANQGGMQQGSYSIVKYSHGEQKSAMVMLATYESGTGSDFLADGQNCVQGHEDNGEIPDIYAISYYAAQIQQYPVTPESSNNQPAGTVTGMGYWLLRHLNGQSKLKMNTEGTENDGMKAKVIIKEKRNITFTISHDDDEWLDVTPLLKIAVANPDKNWGFKFYLNGDLLSNTKYIQFSGKLRMYGGHSHKFEIEVSAFPPLSSSALLTLDLHPYMVESDKETNIQHFELFISN